MGCAWAGWGPSTFIRLSASRQPGRAQPRRAARRALHTFADGHQKASGQDAFLILKLATYSSGFAGSNGFPITENGGARSACLSARTSDGWGNRRGQGYPRSRGRRYLGLVASSLFGPAKLKKPKRAGHAPAELMTVLSAGP